MIEYKCLSCGAPMSSPESMAGEIEACPKCKVVRAVPELPDRPKPEGVSGFTQARPDGPAPTSPPPRRAVPAAPTAKRPKGWTFGLHALAGSSLLALAGLLGLFGLRGLLREFLRGVLVPMNAVRLFFFGVFLLASMVLLVWGVTYLVLAVLSRERR